MNHRLNPVYSLPGSDGRPVPRSGAIERDRPATAVFQTEDEGAEFAKVPTGTGRETTHLKNVPFPAALFDKTS